VAPSISPAGSRPAACVGRIVATRPGGGFGRLGGHPARSRHSTPTIEGEAHMGDKGKKDKDKLQKQHRIKNQLEERAKQDKQPRCSP
jgi:hypothetical protein